MYMCAYLLNTTLLIYLFSFSYKIAVLLQSKYENYDRVIASYLKDSNLRIRVFHYIHETLTQLREAEDITGKKDGYSKLKAAVISHLSDLIDLNADDTTHLILYHFTEDYEKIIDALSVYPNVQFKFLKILIGIDESSSINNPTSELLQQRDIQVGTGLHKTFLALMCQYEPQRVLSYLRSHAENFELDFALNLCKKYKIIDATAHLLETAGDTSGAVNLYLESLAELIFTLKKRLVQEAKVIDINNELYLDLEPFEYINHHAYKIASNYSNQKALPLVDNMSILDIPESKEVKKTLKRAVAVCERSSDNEIISTRTLKNIWYSLLDTFVQLQRELRTGYFRNTVEENSGTPKKKNVYKKRKLLKISESSVSLTDFDDEVSIEQNIREHHVRVVNTTDNIHNLEQQILKEFNQEKLEQLQITLTKMKQQLEALQENMTTLHERQKQAMDNPYSAHNLPKLANLWLQVCLGMCVNYIYSSIITSGVFEWAEILQFTVNRYGTDHFGHFKEPLTELFANCTSEGTLYKSMKELLDKDVYGLHRTYIVKHNRGCRPVTRKCLICQNALAAIESEEPEEMEVKVFNCGHAYHRHCFAALNLTSCPVCVTPAQSDLHRLLTARPQNQSQSRPHSPPIRKNANTVLPAHKKHRIRRMEIALGLNEPKLPLLRENLYDIKSYQRDVKRERAHQREMKQEQQNQQQQDNGDDSLLNENNQADSSIFASFIGKISFFKSSDQRKDNVQNNGSDSLVPVVKTSSMNLVDSFDDFF
jgi:hypothetical protein